MIYGQNKQIFPFLGIWKACAKLKQARTGNILSAGDWGLRERSGDDLLWGERRAACTWKTCVWEASLDHEARDQESGVTSRKC